MGSWNFSRNYMTNYSFQVMSDEEDEVGFVSDTIDNIKDSIDKVLDNKRSFEITNEFYLWIELDRIREESGYYNGVRLEPVFTVSLCHDTAGITVLQEEMEYDNEVDTYTDYIYRLLKDNFNSYFLRDVKENKLLENFFYEVNNIMLQYCEAYTVGWCASKVPDSEVVCMMHSVVR